MFALKITYLIKNYKHRLHRFKYSIGITEEDFENNEVRKLPYCGVDIWNIDFLNKKYNRFFLR